MPKGSSLERLEAIKSFGAEVEITDENYDNTVAMVKKMARENGWVLVQDTAWMAMKKSQFTLCRGI